MKVFRVNKKDKISWCMDYSMIVIAKDELHAERCARLNSDDFKKAKLEVTEINLDTEQCVLVANTGA